MNRFTTMVPCPFPSQRCPSVFFAWREAPRPLDFLPAHRPGVTPVVRAPMCYPLITPVSRRLASRTSETGVPAQRAVLFVDIPQAPTHARQRREGSDIGCLVHQKLRDKSILVQREVREIQKSMKL